MNPIREALYAKLSGDAALQALAKDVYPSRAPQDAETPYVIFHKNAGTPRRTFKGAPLDTDRWLVKGVCRGGDAGPAEAIAARVDELLDNATLVIDGRTHHYLARDEDVEYPEADGADTIYHVGAVYRLISERA